MVKVIGVRFHKTGKIYDFDPLEYKFGVGDIAVLETDQGIEFGEVIYIEKEIKKTKDLKPVLRKATGRDFEKIKELKEKNIRALSVCKKFIKQHNLDMKLIDAEFSFDDKRLTFYFVSETRVDFRELVKDLARHFKKQIRLQQIGPRDEIQYFKDFYGICGQPICCVRFLKGLESVTMDMVRIQNMSQKGASKLSGSCGRLMCCLAYEADLYEELLKNLPQIGDKVKTKQGKGEVSDLNILTQKVEVSFDDSNKIWFKNNEVKAIKR